jgi:hypothetical protein
MTRAQHRLLTVIADASSRGIRPGEAAFQAGYKGKGRSGAGRAPQWTGRVLLNMPEGLVKRDTGGMLYITARGLAALARQGREGA